MIILGALGAQGPQVHCDGSAQKMNPPQKIALFGNMAPRGPLGPPKMAPCGPLGPLRAPWVVVILATRMIILTTRMIILMLYQRPVHAGMLGNWPFPSFSANFTTTGSSSSVASATA